MINAVVDEIHADSLPCVWSCEVLVKSFMFSGEKAVINSCYETDITQALAETSAEKLFYNITVINLL